MYRERERDGDLSRGCRETRSLGRALREQSNRLHIELLGLDGWVISSWSEGDNFILRVKARLAITSYRAFGVNRLHIEHSGSDGWAITSYRAFGMNRLAIERSGSDAVPVPRLSRNQITG